MMAENRLGSAAHTAKLQEVQPGRQAILFQGYPPCETLARSWMWKRLAQVQDLRRGGCSNVSSPAVHGDPGPLLPLTKSFQCTGADRRSDIHALRSILWDEMSVGGRNRFIWIARLRFPTLGTDPRHSPHRALLPRCARARAPCLL